MRNLHLKQNWGIPNEAGQKQSRLEATTLELVQETEMVLGRESGHPSPGPAHIMGLAAQHTVQLLLSRHDHGGFGQCAYSISQGSLSSFPQKGQRNHYVKEQVG